MSTIVSIMYLIFGAAIAAISFTKKFKGKNLIIISCVALLVITGIWDIINRTNDSKVDIDSIKGVVKSASDTSNYKIDSGVSVVNKKISSSSSDIKDKIVQNTDRVIRNMPLTPNGNSYNTAQKDSNLIIQSTVNGDHAHVVNGVNNGINGSVTINNGPPQRILTVADKASILKKVERIFDSAKLDREIPIYVTYPEGNNEARIFANEVAAFLRQLGYVSPDGTYISASGPLDKHFRYILNNIKIMGVLINVGDTSHPAD